MTLRPRRRPGRSYGLTLAPLRTHFQDQASALSTSSITDTNRQWWPVFPTRCPETTTTQRSHTKPLLHPPLPTSVPTESTTSWWPPGVKLGPRPSRPYLPIHIVDPSQVKWRRKFPNIWFRTGGTRFTYAPEILNYPITFDWKVPKEKRVDRYTARPNWPLNSPLFGSKQVYDYLDDVSLPPPLESGETEFPPTSPEPWWTYPPWWEEKIVGEVNGTTGRPAYTIKTITNPSTTKLPTTTTTKPIVTQPIYTTETTTKRKENSKIIITKLKQTDKSSVYLGTTSVIPDASLKPKPEHVPEKVINHEGPWWKLTIIQQLLPTTLAPNISRVEGQRVKRYVRHSRPLVRQNAIRRKNNKSICRKNNSNKITLRPNSEGCTKKGGLLELSKSLLENMLRSAVYELSREMQHHIKSHSSDKDFEFDKEKEILANNLEIHNALTYLYNFFLSGLNNFTEKKQKNLAYELVTSEIGDSIQKNFLYKSIKVKNNFDKNSQISREMKFKNKVKGRDVLKTKIMKLIKLFCKQDLSFGIKVKSSHKFLRSIFKKAEIDFSECTMLFKKTVKRKEIELEIQKEHTLYSEVTSYKGFSRYKRENNIVDFNKSLNLSSQSMEKIVDEIVEEIPMKSLNQEMKTDLVAELHTNRLKQLGKKNINKDVILKMAEFEDDNLNIDKMTVNPVKQVITQLMNEVLSTLRKHDWMNNVMVKLFEEGFSIDSVVESIVKQISIESLLKSMEEEGVNITPEQKQLVLSEFKGYKPMLNEMLKKEILLWEYQLKKNQTLIRQKRNPSCNNYVSNFDNSFKPKIKQKHYLQCSTWLRSVAIKHDFRIRRKRDIEDINLSTELKRIEPDNHGHSETQLNIDKELFDMEKSSMSDDKKMKKLKKHLKWLKSQTENPADIVFPDNFEEELMKKGSYEEEKVRGPRIPKKRYQWNVRTKKPILKVYTFLPKIRLTRGKPFVPLTTTEDHLEIPETQPPTRKRRTYVPPPSKQILIPASLTTLQSFKKNYWLDFTYKTLPPKIVTRMRDSQRPRVHRKRTGKPESTFATLKTFPTMKFGKNTQQPIISLQEFLKRRDEFRRGREEVMWNRNFMTSSEQVTEKPFTKAISEEEDKLSEEEDFEFDAKLSAEVNPADFTMRPMSDFLYLKPEITTNHVFSTSHPSKDPLRTRSVTRSLKGTKIATKSKVTRKFTKKTGYTKVPNKGSSKTYKRNTSKKHNSSISQSEDYKKREVQESQNDSNGMRKKRDLLVAYSFRPLTTKKSEKKSSADEEIFDVTQNNSQTTLELNTGQPKTEINSFETYQIEHKKWFGERRRTSPVNNFDIDWDQMRRKLEVAEISSWQKQKTAHLDTTPSTITMSPSKTNLLWPDDMFPENYKPEFKQYKSKPFFRNYIPEEKSSDLKTVVLQETIEPPFGKADKDGKTAFGRLYQEPKKRHYLLHDNRDLFFDKNEIRNLINKTYDAEFRIKTHRRTHWYNRTFDPKYVFTQYASIRNISKVLPVISKSKPNSMEITFPVPEPVVLNDSQTVDPHFDSYVKLLRGHRVISIRPKHMSFRDIKNNTVVVNQENDTFILQRSNKIPWDNKTNIDVYKTYRKSRKRFYNKTIDIVFSYYIFHKFHCDNASRDVGYGRMSNVVNRWYNRTFVPKYRPDMFYLHNRYKSGKEFNYYKNEFNILHALMSEGKFDPSRWAQVIPRFNQSEPKRSRIEEEFNRINKESAEYEKRLQHVLRSKEESRESFKAISKATVKMYTTLKWKEKSVHKTNYKLFTTLRPTSRPKLSFFQAVKEKSFSFLKNLFRKENVNKSEN